MRTRKTTPPPRNYLPPAMGWPTKGGGAATIVTDPPHWRATSNQVCGLWPFASGTGAPMSGVPLGRHLITAATVCCDPISWFTQANLISNPSMFVLGKPGLGKSTLVRRMCLGARGMGVLPLVLGDTKPDYVDLIEAIGGQVISIGAGRDLLNPLDISDTLQAANEIGGVVATTLRTQGRSRQLHMLLALAGLVRRTHLTDREEAILDRALDLWETTNGVTSPTIGDILTLINAHLDPIDAAALSNGSKTRYDTITEPLRATLTSLTLGRWGELFCSHTTTPMRLDAPVVFDVSDLDRAAQDVQGAALLACWSYGFSQVNTAQSLSDAGLTPPRHYFIVMDELWRILRAGVGMVDRIDELTRLNRTRGVGQAMITHTMADLRALPDPAEIAKARGFVERSGMVICGGLPYAEMEDLTGCVPLSKQEQNLLVSWQDPPAWDSRTGIETAPPGRGKFLIKVGGRPGLPIQVELTHAETALNDTNKRWNK